MKNSSKINWLVDLVIVIGLAGLAFLLVPLVSALFGSLLFPRHPYGTLFRVEFLAVELVPYIVIGALLGLASGWLVRHRKLFVACLPAVAASVFLAFFLLFGPVPFPRVWSWFDIVIISEWLLLIAASMLSAWLILRRRQTGRMTEA